MDGRIEIYGSKVLMNKMKRLGSGALQEASASLYRSGQEIITLSKERYCPWDTGTLMSTLDAETPKIQGSDVTVTLHAGGPSAPYAVNVHETNKNYHHGRQWKYLETPAKLSAGNVLKALKADLMRKFGEI